MWLKPTNDLSLLMKAFENIESNEPGQNENVCTAIIYAAKYFKNYGKVKKVLVLVDDDSGDDSHLMETALTEMKKAKMTLYVINRQCPFQSEWMKEPFEFLDSNGDVWKGIGRVHRGPETARPEIVDLGYGGLSQ